MTTQTTEQRIIRLEEKLAEREALIGRFTAPIVCICGSTRFKQAWISENARLTGEGNIVLAVGLWGHHEHIFPDAETKEQLDNLHKHKIDLCDWIWVLDIGGYIGESTRSEIKYAKRLGKPIRYLSKEFPNYKEPENPFRVENKRLQTIVDNTTAEVIKIGELQFGELLQALNLEIRPIGSSAGPGFFMGQPVKATGVIPAVLAAKVKAEIKDDNK